MYKNIYRLYYIKNYCFGKLNKNTCSHKYTTVKNLKIIMIKYSKKYNFSIKNVPDRDRVFNKRIIICIQNDEYWFDFLLLVCD